VYSSELILINHTPPVFYAVIALWDSLPNFVLLQGTVYSKVCLSFLWKKVRESDTEGTRDKKNMTSLYSNSIIIVFHLGMDMHRK
jgi:hypothetical protein